MKNKILYILEHRNKPIKRRELRDVLFQMNEQTSDRLMRKTIENMIKKDGELIESCSQGYYLIRDGNQLNRAMTYLNSYAEQIAIRKNCLIRNWFAKNKSAEKKKQFEIEFS